jgi:hypothetical protein
MSRKSRPIGLLVAISPRLRAGGIVCGVRGFNGPKKNAIIRSKPGSSGECRLTELQKIAMVPLDDGH